MTVEQARQIVKQKLAQIAMGGDPAQEVKEGKNAPLFHEVIETFLQEHVDAKLNLLHSISIGHLPKTT